MAKTPYKLLAVSGGLDSVVLLHQYKDDPAVLVAHFNHGTRPSADDDQRFVANLAARYHKPFLTAKHNLGPSASEDQARQARYLFLKSTASQHHATLYTAHHQDDLLESIAINLLRGTGWRGLTPMSDPAIRRPLLAQTKHDLLRYAAAHQLTFRQDPTNTDDHYLRNRLRPLLQQLPAATRQNLISLAQHQKTLKLELDQLLDHLLPQDGVYQRAWFAPTLGIAASVTPKSVVAPDSSTVATDAAALELLRAALARHSQTHPNQPLKATHPQLQAFLHAIRTYAPGKQFNLPGDHLITLHKTYFVL